MLPEGEETPEKIRYQAASPDEAALVAAAKNFGFFFYRSAFLHNLYVLLFFPFEYQVVFFSILN